MGKSSAAREARRARKEEEERKKRISSGSEMVRQKFGEAFNDDYYAKLLKSVEDFYIGAKDDKGVFQPGQVTTQFEDARKQMQAALQRAGLADSSVAATKEAKAQEAFKGAKQDVTQRGIAMQNQRKQDVASAESNVLNQLANTADTASAFSNATAQIKANFDMPATPMLGQIFTDLSAGLATQAELERQGNARYNVFGRIPGWKTGGYTRNVGGG